MTSFNIILPDVTVLLNIFGEIEYINFICGGVINIINEGINKYVLDISLILGIYFMAGRGQKIFDNVHKGVTGSAATLLIAKTLKDFYTSSNSGGNNNGERSGGKSNESNNSGDNIGTGGNINSNSTDNNTASNTSSTANNNINSNSTDNNTASNTSSTAENSQISSTDNNNT